MKFSVAALVLATIVAETVALKRPIDRSINTEHLAASAELDTVKEELAKQQGDDSTIMDHLTKEVTQDKQRMQDNFDEHKKQAIRGLEGISAEAGIKKFRLRTHQSGPAEETQPGPPEGILPGPAEETQPLEDASSEEAESPAEEAEAEHAELTEATVEAASVEEAAPMLARAKEVAPAQKTASVEVAPAKESAPDNAGAAEESKVAKIEEALDNEDQWGVPVDAEIAKEQARLATATPAKKETEPTQDQWGTSAKEMAAPVAAASAEVAEAASEVAASVASEVAAPVASATAEAAPIKMEDEDQWGSSEKQDEDEQVGNDKDGNGMDDMADRELEKIDLQETLDTDKMGGEYTFLQTGEEAADGDDDDSLADQELERIEMEDSLDTDDESDAQEQSAKVETETEAEKTEDDAEAEVEEINIKDMLEHGF